MQDQQFIHFINTKLNHEEQNNILNHILENCYRITIRLRHKNGPNNDYKYFAFDYDDLYNQILCDKDKYENKQEIFYTNSLTSKTIKKMMKNFFVDCKIYIIKINSTKDIWSHNFKKKTFITKSNNLQNIIIFNHIKSMNYSERKAFLMNIQNIRCIFHITSTHDLIETTISANSFKRLRKKLLQHLSKRKIPQFLKKTHYPVGRIRLNIDKKINIINYPQKFASLDCLIKDRNDFYFYWFNINTIKREFTYKLINYTKYLEDVQDKNIDKRMLSIFGLIYIQNASSNPDLSIDI